MALISLRVCAGWSEPLLVAHTTLLEISCHGLFVYDRYVLTNKHLNRSFYLAHVHSEVTKQIYCLEYKGKTYICPNKKMQWHTYVTPP